MSCISNSKCFIYSSKQVEFPVIKYFLPQFSIKIYYLHSNVTSGREVSVGRLLPLVLVYVCMSIVKRVKLVGNNLLDVVFC